MIRHIVMWTLRDYALGKAKQENAVLLREKLESMKGRIPGIRHLEVGVNHPGAPRKNFDILLQIDFESLNDLEVYQEHPVHREVVEFVRQIRDARAAVDYEI